MANPNYKDAKDQMVKDAIKSDNEKTKEIQGMTDKEREEMLARLKGQVEAERKAGGLASKEDKAMEQIQSQK
tara:strand:- start:6571 stop:6786 length:216 start_codon:yes stop_codon:yes gene_type:complete